MNNSRLFSAGLMLATFAASLDSTVVSVAMYRIGESLNGLTGQAWVRTAFMITSTVSIPVYGKLSDTHGRRPLFTAAIAVFLAGSLLCAFAVSVPMLAACRGVQGIGAGGMLALTSAVLGDVAAPRQRARYGGYFVATYAVASLIGPVTGGVLAGQRTLLVQTITLSMQNALPQADLGVATSANSFFKQIGGTAGTAVFLSVAYSAAGPAIRSAYAGASFPLGAAAPLLRRAASGSRAALDDPGFLSGLSPVLAQPFRAGFTSALDLAFLVSAAVMAAALVLALAIRELPLRTTVATAPEASVKPAEPASGMITGPA
jgi:MFS family permease